MTANHRAFAARIIRPGMSIRRGQENDFHVVRKATPMKDGKSIRFYFKGLTAAYYDANKEALVDVMLDERNRPLFDREFVTPPDSVKEENGYIAAVWTDALQPNVSIAAKPSPPFAQPDVPMDNTSIEQYEYERRIQELQAEVAAEKQYSASLERLVLRSVSKEELLAMALGRTGA